MLNKTESSGALTVTVLPYTDAHSGAPHYLPPGFDVLMLSPAPKPLYVLPGADITIECLSSVGKGYWLYSCELSSIFFGK